MRAMLILRRTAIGLVLALLVALYQPTSKYLATLYESSTAILEGRARVDDHCGVLHELKFMQLVQ